MTSGDGTAAGPVRVGGVGAEGCKHKASATPAVTWRARRGRITLKGGNGNNTILPQQHFATLPLH